MISSVCIFAFTFALPPTSSESRLELHGSATLDYRSLGANVMSPYLVPPSDAGGRWLEGGGAFGLTVFGRRVLDDDAAPPLQPFLQRVARFHIAGGGSDASVDFPPLDYGSGNPTRVHRALSYGSVLTWADGYVGRWLYLAARVDVLYASWRDRFDVAFAETRIRSELAIPISLQAGLRWRDLLLSAGWDVSPYRLDDGDVHVRFWGGAFVSAFGVVDRWVSLGIRVHVLKGGASADASASFWVGRRLKLRIGVSGGRSTDTEWANTFERAGGHAAIEYWFSARWAGALSYSPSWHQTSAAAGPGVFRESFGVTHLVTLTLTTRPR